MTLWGGDSAKKVDDAHKDRITSGYKHLASKGGLEHAKTEFKKACSLTPSDANQTAILKKAALVGSMYGGTKLLSIAARQQSEIRRQALTLQQVMLTHQGSALRDEVQFSRNNARAFNQVVESGIELGIEKNKHAGTSLYYEDAYKLLD